MAYIRVSYLLNAITTLNNGATSIIGFNFNNFTIDGTITWAGQQNFGSLSTGGIQNQIETGGIYGIDAWKFLKASYQTIPGTIGMLGNPEMNMAINFNYENGSIHLLYDTSKDAYSWTLSTSGGVTLQHIAAGSNTPTSPDVWSRNGTIPIQIFATDNTILGTLGISPTETNYRLTVATPGSAGAALLNGNVVIGVGTLSSGSNQWAVTAQPVFLSTATGTSISFYSTPSTTAANFTIANLAGFRHDNVTLGAASAVTTQHGFWATDLTSGVNNYGFRGQVSSGTNKFNLFLDGTAPNYIKAQLLVGATASVVGSSCHVTFDGTTSFGIEVQPNAATSGVSFFACLNDTGSLIGGISRVTTTNAVSFNTTSDARLKKNFRPWNPLDLFDKIRVYEYERIDVNNSEVGIIAQELYALFPAAVRVGGESTKTDPWMIDKGSLTIPIIAEIYNLRQRMAALEKKIK